MPRLLPFFLSLILLSTNLTAQCSREYQQVLELAEEALQARNYKLTINRLLYARDICPAKKEEVNALITEAFAQIEGEKKKAEDAQAETRVALDSAELARQQAEIERQNADEARQRSDSALEVANRVLDLMNFYGDTLGLTIKQVNQRTRYGFVNREAQILIPFQYERAEPFSILNNGFTRVAIDQYQSVGPKGEEVTVILRKPMELLLDTEGEIYIMATSYQQYNKFRASYQTKAIIMNKPWIRTFRRKLWRLEDLEYLQIGLKYRFVLGDTRIKKNPRIWGLRKISSRIGTLTQLKVLAITDSRISSLPPEIGKLDNLKVLNLSGAYQLESLPAEIGQLENLQRLILEDAGLKSLPLEIGQLRNLHVLNLQRAYQLKWIPPEIGLLTNLKILNLSKVPFQNLPSEIGQLTNLEILNLANSALKTLPAEIGQLENLQRLILRWTDLSTLPVEIEKMKHLRLLDITNTLISKEEVLLLRSLLPNCEIVYSKR